MATSKERNCFVSPLQWRSFKAQTWKFLQNLYTGWCYDHYDSMMKDMACTWTHKMQHERLSKYHKMDVRAIWCRNKYLMTMWHPKKHQITACPWFTLGSFAYPCTVMMTKWWKLEAELFLYFDFPGRRRLPMRWTTQTLSTISTTRP